MKEESKGKSEEELAELFRMFDKYVFFYFFIFLLFLQKVIMKSKGNQINIR